MREIFIRVKNEEQLRAAQECLGKFNCEQKAFLLYPVYLKAVPGNEWAGIFTDLSYIFRENERKNIEEMLDGTETSGMVVKNIDEMGFLKARGYTGEVIADSFLYAYNREAIRFYKEQFADIIFMLPDELTDDEVNKMQESSDGIYKVYGRQPVMFTAQSIAGNYGTEGMVRLESLKKDALIAVDEPFGYTTVYTDDPVSMIDKSEIPGRDRIMVDFTVENAADVEAVLESVLSAANGNAAAAVVDIRAGRGHHFRGID